MIFPTLLTLISGFFNGLGFFYFKKASKKFGLNIKGIINLNLIKGVASFVSGVCLYIVALKFGNLSYLYPLAATQYIWIILFGKLLGEKITRNKIIGVILIVIGIGLIGFNG
jgi:uncharacterized membrane protein